MGRAEKSVLTLILIGDLVSEPETDLTVGVAHTLWGEAVLANWETKPDGRSRLLGVTWTVRDDDTWHGDWLTRAGPAGDWLTRARPAGDWLTRARPAGDMDTCPPDLFLCLVDWGVLGPRTASPPLLGVPGPRPNSIPLELQ